MKINAIGIDFGTTNSVVSLCQEISNPKLLTLFDKKIIPTIINYTAGVTFGQHIDKKDVLSIKRLLIEGKNPNNLSVDKICTDIFTKIKDEILRNTNFQEFKAVITVPAYFNNTERSRIKTAATNAGIDVLALLNEPTSAILSYSPEENSTYMIYDFGGGTFDVSIVKYKHGIFEVVGTSGDTMLGGDDIDASIVKALGRTIDEAKTLKESGATNEKLDSIYKQFADKTLKICSELLSYINMEKGSIDKILMVGGTSKIGIIQTCIKEFFDKTPIIYEPDTCVAKGAAIKAFQIINKTNHILIDVTPLTLGIEIFGGAVDPIIRRNSKIPCTKSEIYTIAKTSQKYLKINILQGESYFANKCEKIGELLLPIDRTCASIPRFNVIFSINTEGILVVNVQTLDNSGMAIKDELIQINPNYNLTKEKIIQKISNTYSDENEDIVSILHQEAKNRAFQLVELLHNAIASDGELLVTEELNSIKQKLTQIKIETNNTEEINNLCLELEKYTERFAELRIRKLLNLK